MSGHLYIALLHHPVKNSQGETITTAITNVDLHDMARIGRTFGCNAVFIVTPISLQQELARTIRGHWDSGSGGRRIPDRATAMRLLTVVPDLASVLAQIESEHAAAPTVISTGASIQGDCLTAEQVSARLTSGDTVLILFGTGWGLADEILAASDGALEPILGVRDDYNHLSVRSAVAILLDRVTRGWSPANSA